MQKKIILFGAGKSASFLIAHLLSECAINDWRLTVADIDISQARSKIGSSSYGQAKELQVNNEEQRASLIKEGDLIISLLPPSLHFLIAKDCLSYGKHLLTASYLDPQMMELSAAIKNKGLLFLCEMGLDPGIDHMSAMRLLQQIKQQGGKIHSFKSHCGGLVAPESDDNPWHYKICWNPANIIKAGSSGAVFREHHNTIEVAYNDLFSNCTEIADIGIGELAYYPNRDSLSYINLYDVNDAATFVRTTIRHPDFCRAWHALVNAGLTKPSTLPNTHALSFKKWSETVLPFVDEGNRNQLKFLGLFDDQPIPQHLKTSALVLQYLLEKNLMMRPMDKDMIVMLHEVEFYLGDVLHKTNSRLVVTGEDSVNTAMARTVGLPLGISAGLILKQQLTLTGLHIPVVPEIYEPVLQQLEANGISFSEQGREL